MINDDSVLRTEISKNKIQIVFFIDYCVGVIRIVFSKSMIILKYILKNI